MAIDYENPFQGELKLINQDKTIKDIFFYSDDSFIKTIDLIKRNGLTKENSIIPIKTLSIYSRDEKYISKGNYLFSENANGLSLKQSFEPKNHFCGLFEKPLSNAIITIKLGNFELVVDESTRREYGEYIEYTDAVLNLYNGEYGIAFGQIT